MNIEAEPFVEPLHLPRCHFLFNGLGAGNIGDEAMFAGFNTIFKMEPGSTIEVFDSEAHILQTLPGEYEYLTWTETASCDDAIRKADLVLLVGDTLISELHGIHWPLVPIGARVSRARELGKRVHGIAIGVDFLHRKDARMVFATNHSYLSDWTTRSEFCREALLDLHVEEKNIKVAADLAWLCPVRRPQQVKTDPDSRRDSRGMIAINIVGEEWAFDEQRLSETASALDRVSEEMNVKFMFICNETRSDPAYDHHTSTRVASLMKSKPVVADPQYRTPLEQVELLRKCDAVISQRYHLGLLGVLAERPVALFSRGQKLVQLIDELQAPDLGPHDDIDNDKLFRGIKLLLRDAEKILRFQQAARHRLAERCAQNAGYFLRKLLIQ